MTPRFTVALVGVDGAGKTTVARALGHARLPRPVTSIYMGVNLDASSLMLPTTRVLLAVKQARGGRPDLTGGRLRDVPGGGWGRSVKDGARLVVWTGEEWLRQLVASVHAARGRIVVFDRHFFADYYHADVGGASPRGLPARLHGWMLQHVYPKPGLVICLDAPAEVLFARKPESSLEWLQARRTQYLSLADVLPRFVVIDADRPLDAVTEEVADCITAHWKAMTS